MKYQYKLEVDASHSSRPTTTPNVKRQQLVNSIHNVVATEMQQLYIVRNNLLVLARQSKNEYIKFDSEFEIKAGCVVIYLPRQWRHLWITIANVNL